MLSMSTVAYNDRQSTVTATNLLTYDERRLVAYLKAGDCGDRFEISSLVGVETLRSDQRDDLAQKLR